MKVILKKDDRITLYCKGADSTIYPRLNPKCAELQQITTRHLSVCMNCCFMPASLAIVAAAVYVIT